jgi:hypothetical protein
MLEWVHIKNDFLSYWQNPMDVDTITFRLIWFTSHEIIGFLGLFSIILQKFFLADLIATWKDPIRYMAAQKHIVPVFLTGAKVG